MRKYEAIFAIAFCLTTFRFSVAADKLRLSDMFGQKQSPTPEPAPHPTETPKKKRASSAASEKAHRIRYVPVPSRKASPTAPRTNSTAASSPSQEASPADDNAKDRAQALYLQALQASQHGRYDKALDLCRESLALDPSNLQAQRMSERLESRTGHR